MFYKICENANEDLYVIVWYLFSEGKIFIITQGAFTYSVVSIKRTGSNKRTGWSKNFIQDMKKKNRVVKKLHLVQEKNNQGGKNLQNS